MKVLIDACVLYPTVMREMVLGCAAHGLFVPRWSERILEEWARAAGRLGEAQEVFARGEIAGLGARWPDAVVEGYETQSAYGLPDPNDEHVLAAAVAGSCDAIMTVNAKDFPRRLLAQSGLMRVDPDAFLLRLHDEAPEPVDAVAHSTLAEARRLSGEDWVGRKLMKKARLPRIGKRIFA